MANKINHDQEQFQMELTPSNYELASCIAKILKCPIARLVSFCLRGVINPQAIAA